MERLKELLSDGYLNTAAYFTESWRLFLEMLKNEKKWIFLIFMSSIVSRRAYSIFAKKYEKIGNMNMEGQEKLMSELYVSLIILFLAVIVIYISYNLFLKKVINKIEAQNNITFIKGLYRAFISTLIIIAGVCAMALNIGGVSVISMVLFVITINIIFSFLYFPPLYMTRNVTFLEAVKYNFYLSRRNKLRMIFPLSLLFFSGTLIFMVMTFILSLAGQKTATLILYMLAPLFDTVLMAVMIIMASIIYLNREYMDMREGEIK